MKYYVIGQTPIWWMLTKIRLARICGLLITLLVVTTSTAFVRFARVDWCLSLFKFIATTFFALFYVQSVSAHEFVATIIKINDGDTLTALVNNETTKIRLLDVDCYETKKNGRAKLQQQYYGLSYEEMYQQGKQSRKKLKNLLKDHRYIRVEWGKRDSFGRILGKVYLDDIKSNGIIDINQYMLESGGCNKYLPKSVLKKSNKEKNK